MQNLTYNKNNFKTIFGNLEVGTHRTFGSERITLLNMMRLVLFKSKAAEKCRNVPKLLPGYARNTKKQNLRICL